MTMADEKRQAHLYQKTRHGKAYHTGRMAHKAGIRYEDCPYPENSVAASAWRAGWTKRHLGKRA